ncbi:MAG TPA: hypothetical protein VFJ74_13925 [Gemmatimonadaceae bacterium]|nr:hypothetical protein [Gemmatimonadaceae bacterium]
MTSDDRFDDLLREAARDYNAPPASVPRDEMWERIAAARAARHGAPAPADASDLDDAPAPNVIVLPVGRRRWQSAAWARALAAALLLAVGIGVGRLTVSHDTSSPDSLRAVATAGTSDATTPPSTLAGRPDTSTPAVAPRSAQLASTNGGATRDREPSTSPDARPATRSPADGAEGRVPAAESPLPYRLAAAEHLALTETLLTTVSADARAGRADSSVALWARDLLGTTRMLLDSPAARDPKMARLLEDLELVLAEVAQLRPARGDGSELRAIDRTVRQRGVLTRLRATVPVGPLSAGT